MSKISRKIAFPIILAGFFAIVVFVVSGQELTGLWFYSVVTLLVVYVFFFGWATGQKLSSPVHKMLNRATELSKGDLSSRVYLESKDELAELADVFNKIAEQLEASRAQGDCIEKSVGVKVRAKTQELEETVLALEQKVKNRTIELERLMEESNKMQKDLKDKKIESAVLRKELDTFKKKIIKTNNPKQVSA